MSKRISIALSLLLVLAMMISVVGCAQQEETTESEAPQQEEPAPGTEEEVAEEEPAEEVVLEFWDMQWGNAGEYDVLAEEIAHRYEEVVPNVKIEYTNNPWSNWFELYSTAVASGDAPDVASGGGFMPFQFAVNGESADLGWIVDQWKADGQYDDYLANSLEYYTYDGSIVGINFNYDVRMTCIRKDWLAEMNLEMPTTYEEFIEVAKAFAGRGDETYGVAYGVTTGSAGPFYSWGQGNGGVFYDKEGNADVNNDRNLTLMKFYRTLKDEGILPEGIENFTGDEANALFLNGQAGILIKSVSDYTNAYKTLGGDKVCIMPPVTSPAGFTGQQINPNGHQIFTQTEHMQEALEFLKWFEENNEELWSSGYLPGYPARVSYWENEEMQSAMRQDVIQNLMSVGVTLAYPLLQGTASGSSIEGLGFDQKIMQAALLNDEETWADTLQEIEDEVQVLIDDLDAK